MNVKGKIRRREETRLVVAVHGVCFPNERLRHYSQAWGILRISRRERVCCLEGESRDGDDCAQDERRSAELHRREGTVAVDTRVGGTDSLRSVRRRGSSGGARRGSGSSLGVDNEAISRALINLGSQRK